MNWAVDLQTATTVLSILGKALVCISFAVVYVHSSEMFPTEVRNVGLGTASMCARISSLAASYVGGPLVNIPGMALCLGLYLLYAPSKGPFIHTHALSCALLAIDLNSDAVKDNILKVEGPDWTFEAKAKAVEHTTIAEIKICNTSGSLTG